MLIPNEMTVTEYYVHVRLPDIINTSMTTYFVRP